MSRFIFLACCLLAVSANSVRNKRQSTARSFPSDFFFGTATASYQIEGAWDVDGKSLSIWDYLARTDPDFIYDSSNGDIAANSYYLYERDIEMLKELGVTHYRFSIAWPRILPYGRADYVNQRGIDHYNAFIDELIANGITPFATMYHWDLPQNLQELGGWLNEEIVDWFGDYARVLYQNFGDRVKHWLTINEPFVHCSLGHGYASHAPRIRSPGIAYYECGRHIILANARAYHIYDDEFRSSQGGQVGIVISSEYVYPATDSEDDIQATSDYLEFHLGQYMNPIFSETGNYPQVMIDRVEAASLAQGYNSSRLRAFSQEQIDYIRGTSDFLGLNHYSTRIVYRNSSVIGKFEIPSYDDDSFADSYLDESWPLSSAPWIREHGPGFYQLLVYIKDKYNNPLIYITENGVATSTGLNDDVRVSYYRDYLTAVLDALDEGCNIQGYFAWSLMDNFEWAYGYLLRFGLYEVDMEDPDRTRTPRKSALVYKEIVSSRLIDYQYNPDPYETDGAYAIGASVLTIAVVVINILVYCLLAARGENVRNKTQSTAGSFPSDFVFGTATASYQIEGAWDVDGKSWSIWDHLVRTNPDFINDNSNGDFAANSYYLYKRDIEMLKELGVTHYRFSIAWPRILPYGRANYVNQRGIDHYNAFIDELIANGITPFATMYHWDLPQNLQELGGWLNEEIVDWFGDYARVLYQHFGDRVKHWLTINEPFVHCALGHGYASQAPRIRSPGIAYYECGRHVLLANARAYHIYDDEFRNSQGGQVGIVISSEYVYPASDSEDDIQATSDYLEFHLGQYMNPIFSETGNYPQVMIDRVEAASLAQGYNSSRLRAFSQEQIDYIRGTCDFLGLNHYLTRIVYRNSSVIGKFEIPSYDDDSFADSYLDDSWPLSSAPWIREHGPGFYHLLVHIKDTYNNPVIYITENGVADTTGLNDDVRVSYYRSYLTALLDALDEGCNIQGYFAWSLMDNFEWNFGYSLRFGLYEVDWEDPERKRTPRKSALVYKEIVRSRVIDYQYNPDPYATDGAYATDGSYAIGASVLTIALTVVSILV